MFVSLLLAIGKLICLLILRMLLSPVIAILPAMIYVRVPAAKHILHLFQGASSAVASIFLSWLIFRIWTDDLQTSNLAATMTLIAIFLILSNTGAEAREKGILADSIGAILGSLAILVTGIELY